MVTDTSTVKVSLRTLPGAPAVCQFKQPRAFYGREAHSRWANLQVTAKWAQEKLVNRDCDASQTPKKNLDNVVSAERDYQFFMVSKRK